jgi:hypothetical protein
MVLDALVEDPDLVWLATAEEKAAHLKALTRIDQLMLPHVTTGEGERRATRYFPERLPIGIHPAGRGVLVYVVSDPWLDEFRIFLERHAVLVRALPAWTLRIVVPPHLPGVGGQAKETRRSTTCSRCGTESRPRRRRFPCRNGTGKSWTSA